MTTTVETPRPAANAVRYALVPSDLRDRPQWVCFKLVKQGDRYTKVPYNARTGSKASSTDAATWSTFAEARNALHGLVSYAGIGFVFSEQDPFIAIDLDHCRDANTGEREPWAQRIIEQLTTYTEVSPSGTGVHIIASASLELVQTLIGRKAGNIEMYAKGRFFTVTGEHVQGTPITVEERSEQLGRVYAFAFTEKEKQGKKPDKGAAMPASSERTDNDLLSIIRRSAQGVKFEQLWQGDISDYDSASNADLALCGMLAFYCGPTGHAQVDRLFRASRLMRDKWDERHGAATYGESTIAKAIAARDTFYQTGEQHREKRARSSQRVLPESFQDIEEPDPYFVLDCLDQEEYGDSLLFAFLFKGKLVYDHAEKAWYQWHTHYWKRDETSLVRQLIAGYVGGQYLIAASDLLKKAVGLSTEEAEGIQALAQKCTKRAASVRKLQRANNISTFAASPLGISGSEWDSNPWLLGTPTGVLNLKTGELRNGQPEDYIRTIARAEWQGLHAPCERWEAFLQEIFDDQTDKAAFIAYLHRMLGYSITGLSDIAVFPVLHGEEGRNGKSTLIKHLGHVLGSIAGTISSDVLIDSKGRTAGSAQPYLVDLQGKRLVWVSETHEGARFNVAQVKHITGNDVINARGLYEKSRTWKPTHTILLLTNHKPHADATDRAFWERVKLIPFNLRFVDTPLSANERKRDSGLDAALEREASGILAWLVRGCLSYQEQGLNTPSCVRSATEGYQKEEDTLEQFITDACLVGEGFTVGATQLYKAYSEWSNGLNSRPMSGTAFGTRAAKRFSKERTNRGLVYSGVGLLAENSVGYGLNPTQPSRMATQAALDGAISSTSVGCVGETTKLSKPDSLVEKKSWKTLHNPTLVELTQSSEMALEAVSQDRVGFENENNPTLPVQTATKEVSSGSTSQELRQYYERYRLYASQKQWILWPLDDKKSNISPQKACEMMLICLKSSDISLVNRAKEMIDKVCGS